MTGLYETITLSFMIVGHTKFSPASSFGLFKQKFRKTAAETLKDIGDVVVKSASCSSFQIVGWEDGMPLIPTYDWSTFFTPGTQRYKEIPPSLVPSLEMLSVLLSLTHQPPQSA